MVLATSSALPIRPIGAARSRPARIRCGSFARAIPSSTIGVSANDGCTEFTRILVARARYMQRRRFRQHPHGALAGAIGCRRRVADDPGDRGEIDDRAAAGFLHRSHCLTAAEKRALDVHRVDLAPVSERRRLDVAEDRDPGAIDEYVEAPERADHRIDDFPPARFVGHVLHQREIGVGPERLEAGFVAVGGGDLGPLTMKQGRRSPANARRRAGDERDLSRETPCPCSVHRSLPPSEFGCALAHDGPRRYRRRAGAELKAGRKIPGFDPLAEIQNIVVFIFLLVGLSKNGSGRSATCRRRAAKRKMAVHTTEKGSGNFSYLNRP